MVDFRSFGISHIVLADITAQSYSFVIDRGVPVGPFQQNVDFRFLGTGHRLKRSAPEIYFIL